MTTIPKVIIQADESERGQRFQQWFGTVIDGGFPRTEEQLAAAKHWYKKIMKSEAIDAVIVPSCREGRNGCYVIVTSETSKYVHRENIDNFHHTGLITNPDWLHRAVYWYNDLVPGNIDGMSQWWYRGRWIGRVNSVMDEIFIRKGKPHWSNIFCRLCANQYGRYYEDGPLSYQDFFRDLIWEAFDPNFIIEYRIDLSVDWFRGLSIGMRIHPNPYGGRLRKPKQEAIFIVGCVDDPWQREDIDADDWWKYTNWRSIGQSEIVSEWVLRRKTV